METSLQKQTLVFENLPLGWSREQIGEYVEDFVGGCSPSDSDYKSTGFLALNKGNIKPLGRIIFGDKRKFVSQEYAKAHQGRDINFLDLVVTLRDLSQKADFLGLIGIYRENESALLTQGACLIRLKKGLEDKYLVYYSNSPTYRKLVKANKHGSTQVHLRNGDFLCFPIPIPPLVEQRRIVAKIEELFSELDQGIETLKQARAQLAVYRQALLKHAFEGKLTADWREEHADELESGEVLLARRKEEGSGFESVTTNDTRFLPTLPEEWIYGRLGAFVDSMGAGKSFSCEERRPRQDEVGVAKVSAVTWGEYQEAESKTCVDLTKVNPSFYIQKGDFLLSRANTIDLVGACVIVRKVTQRIMLSDKTLRLGIQGLPQEYLLYYLRSRQGRKEIMARSTGNQESMRNIGQDRIRSIIVPVCSVKEATKIASLLETHLAAIDAEEADIDLNLQKAEALRQSILKKAFAGELVPQDPADEPASELLARIQAKREAAVASPRTARKVTRKTQSR